MTYLSLRTTPSMQAPNRTTELKSERSKSRRILCYKALLQLYILSDDWIVMIHILNKIISGIH